MQDIATEEISSPRPEADAARADITWAMAEVRNSFPEMLNLNDTSDRVGILLEKTPADCTATFLKDLSREVLKLERRIMHKLAGGDEGKSIVLALANIDGKEAKKLEGVEELVNFLLRISHLPSDAEERNDYLSYKVNGAKKPRYGSEFLANKYIPNRLKPLPFNEYDFQEPAQCEFRIKDYKEQRDMVFEFFPLGHSRYIIHKEGRKPYELKNLRGSSIQEATEILAMKNRNTPEETAETVKEAEVIEPYFRLRLEDPIYKRTISVLQGILVAKEGRVGFKLKADGFEPFVFVSLPGANRQENGGIRMKALVSEFMSLGVKKPVKEIAQRQVQKELVAV